MDRQVTVRREGTRMPSFMIAEAAESEVTGKPFNIASHAPLAQVRARVTGHAFGEFVHAIGDAHICSNHMDQVRLQLSGAPMPPAHLRIRREVGSILDFLYEDSEVLNHESDPAFRAPVAVRCCR